MVLEVPVHDVSKKYGYHGSEDARGYGICLVVRDRVDIAEATTGSIAVYSVRIVHGTLGLGNGLSRVNFGGTNIGDIGAATCVSV